MLKENIFLEYYRPAKFIDRFAIDGNPRALTVIIPVIHTNELWRKNLLSIYREVPVAELLISDGGCIDDTIKIVEEFPRVRVLDHRSFKSLGFSIRKMIEEVKTEWFFYVHSDVYLPAGWFDQMFKHSPRFDWFGCIMRHTLLIEYEEQKSTMSAHMGRTQAFDKKLASIHDDYLGCNVDQVLASLVRRSGVALDVFNYKQTMHQIADGDKIRSVDIRVEMTPAEEIRTWVMQLKGIVKYLDPTTSWPKKEVAHGAFRLLQLKAFTESELYAWVKVENPRWLPVIKNGIRKKRLYTFFEKIYRLVVGA